MKVRRLGPTAEVRYGYYLWKAGHVIGLRAQQVETNEPLRECSVSIRSGPELNRYCKFASDAEGMFWIPQQQITINWNRPHLSHLVVDD